MEDLERISERIEIEALRSLHDHCPAETKEALGLHLISVSDCLAACARNDPSILLNRAAGLGTESPVVPESLSKIVDSYKELDIDNYFLHLYESDLSTEAQEGLSSVGLNKTRGWMKFCRDTSPPADAPTNLKVERVGPDRATDFGEIVCRSFGMTEAAIPLLAGLANDPRWYLFVSYDGNSPAGAGSLFVLNDTAWIEWGATNPEFRCRGSQAAIMAARINKAKELGCTHIFTETGEAVEGDAQHSYKNILKQGFKEMRLRQNYRPKQV